MVNRGVQLLYADTSHVKLKVPEPRQQTFETVIIERYRRWESSVEEALIEMYLSGLLRTSLKRCGARVARGMAYTARYREGSYPFIFTWTAS